MHMAHAPMRDGKWEMPENKYDSNLIASKNRLAPVKKLSIDRIELCGAVLNKRIEVFIEKEARYEFTESYHIVDSQIVQAMIQKESYGFNTFAGTRIGEIQQGTNPKDWYWIKSDLNIADYLTRGKTPKEIRAGSSWQKGPEFLRKPKNEWQVSQNCYEGKLPETLTVVMATEGSRIDTLETRINIDRHSSFIRLVKVTARVLAMYSKNERTKKASFYNVSKVLLPEDIEQAEFFWIRDAQRSIDINDRNLKRLCPRKRDDGIIIVGGRVERWVQMSYNKNEVILLPYNCRFSRLYAEHVHNQGHYGVSTTASKIRSRFWIIGIHRMVKSIKINCVTCKKLDKRLAEQVMGNLPTDRLKPAPPWNCTGIDLFGPFKVRDEIKKRAVGKAYGVIFTCLATRAVYVDLAPDYSTEKLFNGVEKIRMPERLSKETDLRQWHTVNRCKPRIDKDN